MCTPIFGSETGLAVFVMGTEHIGSADLSGFEVILISNFIPSIDKYIQILTRMARFTVNGLLHSFLTREDASLAAPLIEILELCRQPVPKALNHLCESTSKVLKQ